jgi:hypothetical protein
LLQLKFIKIEVQMCNLAQTFQLTICKTDLKYKVYVSTTTIQASNNNDKKSQTIKIKCFNRQNATSKFHEYNKSIATRWLAICHQPFTAGMAAADLVTQMARWSSLSKEQEKKGR